MTSISNEPTFHPYILKTVSRTKKVTQEANIMDFRL